jgi:CRP-like cAMP-binding protein
LKNQINYDVGEFILREHDVADCAYVIMQGEVGIYKNGASGEIIPLGIVKPGEYLGELGIVSGQTRSAEAIALTPVSVVKITKDLLDQELSKVPPWVSALLLGLAERLVKADDLLRKHQTSDGQLLARIQPAVKQSLISGKRKISC